MYLFHETSQEFRQNNENTNKSENIEQMLYNSVDYNVFGCTGFCINCLFTKQN